MWISNRKSVRSRPDTFRGGKYEEGRNFRAWRVNAGRLERDMRHALTAWIGTCLVETLYVSSVIFNAPSHAHDGHAKRTNVMSGLRSLQTSPRS